MSAVQPPSGPAPRQGVLEIAKAYLKRALCSNAMGIEQEVRGQRTTVAVAVDHIIGDFTHGRATPDEFAVLQLKMQHPQVYKALLERELAQLPNRDPLVRQGAGRLLENTLAVWKFSYQQSLQSRGSARMPREESRD